MNVIWFPLYKKYALHSISVANEKDVDWKKRLLDYSKFHDKNDIHYM